LNSHTKQPDGVNFVIFGFSVANRKTDFIFYISGVQIRETYNAGAILKLEVLKGNDWQQVFIVIFGSEQGGKQR
jgi:hypothetical protein